MWTAYKGWVRAADLYLALVLYCLSGLGITLGYHRLMTHRAFETKSTVKFFLLLVGTFAMQGPPASWASLHIQHHRFSDKLGDPHSPNVARFWQAHCGWIFHDYVPDFRRYGKWLLKDKVIKHVSRYYVYYSQIGLVIPLLLGGWVGLIWGGLLRIFLSSHVTWSVNSICHCFGTRAYQTADNSQNNALIALLSFGEGWHNNHHRYMQMPYFGHRWYQLDIGKWVLIFLKHLGLVWNLKIPHK